MKKLMIAAAAVALAGITFADCDTPVECAWAYRLKLAGKTVTGKTSSKVFDTALCDYTSDCWAKPASYRVAGYIWGATTKDGDDDCAECACNDFSTLDNKVFWDANKAEVKFDAVAFDIFDILRNSGAKNKAQILITMDGLNLAGFGVYKPAKQVLKSANGFFAGKIAAPACTAYNSTTCEYSTTAAKVFTLCAIDTAVEAEAAIAYGRWTLTYKGDKVAAYSKTGDTSVFYPAAFTAAE